MKSGAAVKDVYSASIKPIKNTEYFDNHYQGIGHGIGLFVHELPFIGPRHEYVLKENQVTTIEPGIYIPGWGGVRIEDQVVITKDGYENLVTAPKELIEL
jgi:Xaa-Pro aminopeptidase